MEMISKQVAQLGFYSNSVVNKLQQEVLAKDENGYQGLALLMDTVEVTGVKGVFVNKEAIENFFSRLEK